VHRSEIGQHELSFRDGLVLVPLLAVIVFMALYPQLALHRSERSVRRAVASAHVALEAPSSKLAGRLTGTAAPLSTGATSSEGANP
jgi:uncharacterized membrane protein YjfL (UPF0719 family)